MTARIATLVLLAGALLASGGVARAQDWPVMKEGRYWVRTSPEVRVLPARPRLQVSTRGHVALQGGDGNQITWRIEQRVIARTQEEAERLMRFVAPSAETIGDLLRLEINQTSGPRVYTNLTVSVPRQMASVLVETESGGIEAYDINGDLMVRALSGSIQADRIGGNVLLAQTGGGDIRLGKIGGSVERCGTAAGSVYVESSDRDVNCATAGGDVTVQRAGGPLVLSTEGGNIHVDRASGSVRAHSAAGLIEIGQAGGPVYADARGGSIQVGSARGIQAESASGMIRVRAASGPMSVSTALGSILAELVAGARIEDSSLAAGSGDITVLIPPKFPLSVTANNDANGPGRIVSDFPEIRVRSAGFFHAPVMAEGAINGGGPVLHLEAGSGNIYLLRMK
jgi:DUF4097 and DUF4098 domain-containing protein YvlB